MSQSAEAENVRRIGEISDRIREAIYQALPTPHEQFLTIMAPGKVVNLSDYAVDEKKSDKLPLRTELNQAILCDDIPTLSTVQMGPTGRSVSRSYANAISKLVPNGANIGLEDKKKEQTECQKRYEQGMSILSSRVDERPGTPTLVELYTEMKKKYGLKVQEQDKAFKEALARAQADPRSSSDNEVQEAYGKWTEEHGKVYRSNTQSAYMDWVIVGKKEEVEYWFSVVDPGSAKARVERSKEAMRLAVVQDSDGSAEYQRVKLNPPNWANKCLDKIKRDNKQTETVEWYNWEISRLEQANIMLAAVRECPLEIPVEERNVIEEKKQKAEEDLKKAMGEVLKCKAEYSQVLAGQYHPETAGNAKAGKQTVLDNYNNAQMILNRMQCEYDKWKLESYLNELRWESNVLYREAIHSGFINSQIKKNEELIIQYERKCNELRDKLGSSEAKFMQQVVQSLGIPESQLETEPKKPAVPADSFTPITVKVGPPRDMKISKATVTGLEEGSSVSWGLNSLSETMFHSQAHAGASSELVNSEVRVSFECMRVDIARPWLWSELFYDPDLTIARGEKISPGPARLKHLIEKPTENTQRELAGYSLFPMYPVAFLVACNIVLDISGKTSSLQTYMNNSGTSADLNVQYGPFSHLSKAAGSTCNTTVEGCRIEINSPQIIGWISQIVPAIPRID